MTRSRDPTKENARKLYEEGFGSLSKVAEELKVSLNTIKSWKTRDKKEGKDWVQPVLKKGATESATIDRVQTSKKKLMKQAESMIVSGTSIKETANLTGISKSILLKKSSKEKWMQKRKKFLEKMFDELLDEHKEDHIKHRKEAFEYINYLRKKMMKSVTLADSEIILDVKEMTAYRNAIKALDESIEAESKILGITNVNSLIEGDIKESDLDIKIEKLRIDQEKNDIQKERNKIEKDNSGVGKEIYDMSKDEKMLSLKKYNGA